MVWIIEHAGSILGVIAIAIVSVILIAAVLGSGNSERD